MPAFPAIVTTLKTALAAASFALRGDVLPVVLISILFTLVHPGAKPRMQRCRATPPRYRARANNDVKRNAKSAYDAS
jgi:hypothetical protein